MSSKSAPSNADIVIVGGGLAAGLTALRLSIAKPGLKVTVLIDGKRITGSPSSENTDQADRSEYLPETWFFYGSDVSEESMLWFNPMISKSWNSSEVVFPHLKRTFNQTVHAIRSEDFEKFLLERLSESLIFEAKVTLITTNQVTLSNGQIIEAKCVLDARHAPTSGSATTNGVDLKLGYRKSIRYLLNLNAPQNLPSVPITIDADCPQLDGFRFFSVFPWNQESVLIEEVYYSSTPILNGERLKRSVQSYAERKGWVVNSIDRIEKIVYQLPMTAESIAALNPEQSLKIGRAGGYFNTATGNELADAVRLAEFFSSLENIEAEAVRESLYKFRRSWISRQRFLRMLNRFVFFASEPSLRYQIYERVFQFPNEVVEHFLGNQLTWRDRFRIMKNRPQAVTLSRALRSFKENFIHDRLSETTVDGKTN
jgi:lycopene beta-cyclase